MNRGDAAGATWIVRGKTSPRDRHPPSDPPLEINVPDIGVLNVPPHEDPADSVERFALAASQRGIRVPDKQLVEMLTMICEQRVCRRLALRAAAPASNETSADVAAPDALAPPDAPASPDASEGDAPEVAAALAAAPDVAAGVEASVGEMPRGAAAAA